MRAETRSRAALVELVAEISRSIDEAVEPRLIMDEDAFRQFYERTARPLFGYLLQVSGHHHIADDLLQESYCRLLSAKLPAMDESQTKSYLFRIAANLLRDRWRRSEDVAATGAIEASSSGPDPELQTDMRRAFEQLKPRERQLLWLAYVEGANHKEIAGSTGLRTGSVKLLLFRARRKLANMLRSNPSDIKEKVNV